MELTGGHILTNRHRETVQDPLAHITGTAHVWQASAFRVNMDMVPQVNILHSHTCEHRLEDRFSRPLSPRLLFPAALYAPEPTSAKLRSRNRPLYYCWALNPRQLTARDLGPEWQSGSTDENAKLHTPPKWTRYLCKIFNISIYKLHYSLISGSIPRL